MKSLIIAQRSDFSPHAIARLRGRAIMATAASKQERGPNASQRLKPYPEEEILVQSNDPRDRILSSFLTKQAQLLDYTVNREISPHSKLRLAIILVAWEPDDTMKTAAMLEQTLPSLARQIHEAGAQADLFLVTNNAGGPTTAIQERFHERIHGTLAETCPESRTRTVTTAAPEPLTSSTQPWLLEADLTPREFQAGIDQILIIKQTQHPYNKGKIRGLRDVCRFLESQIKANSYRVDLIYQLDAETVLSLEPPILSRGGPLMAMASAFSDPDCQAVTSRDIYLVFDDHSGKHLDDLVPPGQLAMNVTANRSNCNFLAGGSLMSRVAPYLAGISSLAEITPGLGVEDYAYTSLLREAARQSEDAHDNRVVRLIPFVRHVNRIPSGRDAALRQLSNWVSGRNAVDQIFPEVGYVGKPFWWYNVVVIANRLKAIRRVGPVKAFRTLWQDIRDLPALADVHAGRIPTPDIIDSTANMAWTGDAIAQPRLPG